jgi:hypothetical protein
VDAEQLRARFQELLQKHPPAVRRILALDPTLLASQSYLAAYPELAAFLAAHPVIARNPACYLGHGDDAPMAREERITDLRSGMLAGALYGSGSGWFQGALRWFVMWGPAASGAAPDLSGFPLPLLIAAAAVGTALVVALPLAVWLALASDRS